MFICFVQNTALSISNMETADNIIKKTTEQLGVPVSISVTSCQKWFSDIGEERNGSRFSLEREKESVHRSRCPAGSVHLGSYLPHKESQLK